jgi:hypothetical protein
MKRGHGTRGTGHGENDWPQVRGPQNVPKRLLFPCPVPRVPCPLFEICR